MASIIDSIMEIRKQANEMADVWNTSISDKDLGQVISDFFDTVPTIKTPNSDEWKEFFSDYKDSAWDAIKEESIKFGWEMLDTVIAKYNGLFSGYSRWRDNLKSYLGVNSFDEIYSKYNEALFGSYEESDYKKIIINSNEFDTDTTHISLDYDEQDDSPKDYILKTNDATNVARETQKRTRSRKINEYLNKNVGGLILSGPNLQKNMFDVFLIYNDSNSEDTTDNTKFIMFCAPIENPLGNISDNENTVGDTSGNETVESHVDFSGPLQSLIEDVYMLSVRTKSIEIPGRTRESGTWSWIGNTIDIPKSDWSFEGVSSITVDLDANLYIYDIFNALSGFVRPGTYGNGRSGTGQEENKENLYKVLAPGKMGGVNNTIDLCVPVHKLSTYVDGKVDYISRESDILYLFEDVRFLGTGDTINFNNESAALQSISFPFIFKNLRTVYKTDIKPIQVEKDISCFEEEMQKFIFDYAGNPERLIKG